MRTPGSVDAVGGRDLTVRGTMLAAFGAMGAITLLDLSDGRLGAVFAVGLILTSVTAPIAVHVGGVRPILALPVLLLLFWVVVVALVRPEAIVVPGLPSDAGPLARTLAAVIKNGFVLALAAGLGVAAALWRVRTARGLPRR